MLIESFVVVHCCSFGCRAIMAPPYEKVSPPRSDGSTRASTQDSASESGGDPNEPEAHQFADGPLKKAIRQHFYSKASTFDTHNGVPVCWSAGEWNARTWADRDMEQEITRLFSVLGLDAKMSAMKDIALKTYPGRRHTGFWLPVWKFRLDRDAKNGRLAPSPCGTPRTLHGLCGTLRTAV